MYKILFYEDKNGYSDVVEYIKELNKKADTSKADKINFNKIVAYIDMLEEMGTRVGDPVTKHLEGQIWELRPLRNRFLFVYYKDDEIIILSHFIKKTQKTPRREIERAKRRLQDYMERNE